MIDENEKRIKIKTSSLDSFGTKDGKTGKKKEEEKKWKEKMCVNSDQNC